MLYARNEYSCLFVLHTQNRKGTIFIAFAWNQISVKLFTSISLICTYLQRSFIHLFHVDFVQIEMPSAAAPPPADEVARPPRTEHEELQIRANQVTDDVNIFNSYSYLFDFNGLYVRRANCRNRVIYCYIYLYYNHILICDFFFSSLTFRKQSLESTRRMLALCEEVSTQYILFALLLHTPTAYTPSVCNVLNSC